MLSDEQWQKIADKTGCFITGGLKEAIEAEVRKQDDVLILQLVAPTDAELDELRQANSGRLNFVTFSEFRTIARAVLAKWGTPQQEAQEPCPTCVALARTVMLDQVSFDRKPDCYGIRQITDDDGVEEWEDIRTSPDVAREEANDMMATGRGEIYEVVPLWTTPQPTQAQAGAVPLDEARRLFDAGWKAAALFCDREDVVADGIIGFGACPQFEAAFSAAHGIKGGQHGTK